MREEALAIPRAQGHCCRRTFYQGRERSFRIKSSVGGDRVPAESPEVTEVMVNGPDDVYVERKGRMKRAGWRRHGNRR